MSEENTNWEKSAAGVVIKDGKVLLARHTYGAGKGKLIIPGGYIFSTAKLPRKLSNAS